MTLRRRLLIPATLLLAGGLLPLAAQHDRREEGRPERPREGGAPGRGREAGQPPQRMPGPAERPGRMMERPAPEGPSRQVPRERMEPERRSPQRMERERGGPERRAEPPGGPGRARERDLQRAPGRESRPSPRAAETARAWQARDSWRRNAWPARPTWREHRARHWESDHRTWAQRGGYGGYRIPDPLFASRFGIRHPFLLRSRPVIYQGYPRFRCGGYWFLIVDPWPEFWVDDWYLTDEVYVDYYMDGYYLFNPRYPGIRIAVSVFL